jgi:hypothetical protein
MAFKSDKRLYLNADKTKVVEEDAADAAYLFAGVGDEVSDEDAKQYGLKAPKRTEVTEVKAEDEDDKAESKQEPQPENKARTMRSGKD